MNLAVIIPSAGFSSRYTRAAALLGDESGRSKLDEDLGGRPVIQRTVELFTNYTGDASICAIIVAGPHDQAAFDTFKSRHGDKLTLLGATLVRGGKTHRWQTVQAALEHVPPAATHIAVHDAARPCASAELIDRVLSAAAKHPAVIPAVDVSDTLKRVSAEAVVDTDVDPLAAILGGGTRQAVRTVESTIDRAHLVAVQTPQVFRADVLKAAYAQGDLSSTDDAGLVERLFANEPGASRRVAVVEGDARNIKITHPSDLHLARAILGVRPPDAKPAHRRF